MEDLVLPIEVRIVLRDRQPGNTTELLKLLQDIADQWYWQQIPCTPCSVFRGAA